MLMKFALVVVLAVPVIAQGWVDRSTLNGPAPRSDHAMCYDVAHGYTVLVGGRSSSNGNLLYDETWTWDGTTWVLRGPSPSTTYDCVLAYHGSTNTLLSFSPQSSGSGGATLAHAWNGTSWTLAGSTSGAFAGSPRVAGYDPIRQEIVVFLAADRVAIWNGTTLTNMTVLAPAVHLVVGEETSMAWDPVAGRLLVVGTQYGGPSGAYTTRAYEWTGFGWVLRQFANPPARAGAIATDTANNRIVLVDADWNSTQSNHTWMLSNGVATRLEVGFGPTSREKGKIAYDQARGVHVYFGGTVSSGAGTYYFGDTWEFDLGPLASFTSYGTGCVGSRGVPNLTAQGTSLPRVGSTFTAHITNLPWTGPALLVLGLSDTSYSSTPLPIDLGFLGAPSCNLRASIDDIQGLVNVLGAATWSWTIPPVPGASFYTQVLPLDPGLNALGLTASNACHGVIGL